MGKGSLFGRLANALKINDGRGFLEGALIASSADEGSVEPVAEEPIEDVDITQSPALQSLIQSTNPALLTRPQ